MFRTISGLFLSLFFAFSAQAASAYISDNLFTYLHTGPGTNYKIMGSVNAGKSINLTGETSNGFSKVIDERGREGWIKSDVLQTSASFRVQVTELQQQLDNQKQSLSSEQGTTSALREQLAELDRQHQALKDEMKATTQQLSAVKAELASYDDETRMQWFIRGAAVLGGGLLVGIIIPYLPRKKKRNEQWM